MNKKNFFTASEKAASWMAASSMATLCLCVVASWMAASNY